MFRIFQLFGENLKVFLNLTAAVTSRKTTEHTCELVNRYRRHLVDLPLKQVRFTTIIRVDHSGKKCNGNNRKNRAVAVHLLLLIIYFLTSL